MLEGYTWDELVEDESLTQERFARSYDLLVEATENGGGHTRDQSIVLTGLLKVFEWCLDDRTHEDVDDMETGVNPLIQMFSLEAAAVPEHGRKVQREEEREEGPAEEETYGVVQGSRGHYDWIVVDLDRSDTGWARLIVRDLNGSAIYNRTVPRKYALAKRMATGVIAAYENGRNMERARLLRVADEAVKEFARTIREAK